MHIKFWLQTPTGMSLGRRSRHEGDVEMDIIKASEILLKSSNRLKNPLACLAYLRLPLLRDQSSAESEMKPLT
jgi:hypothetical protein